MFVLLLFWLLLKFISILLNLIVFCPSCFLFFCFFNLFVCFSFFFLNLMTTYKYFANGSRWAQGFSTTSSFTPIWRVSITDQSTTRPPLSTPRSKRIARRELWKKWLQIPLTLDCIETYFLIYLLSDRSIVLLFWPWSWSWSWSWTKNVYWPFSLNC